ncbi:DNA polymerase-3 subunit beta [Deinobacterium chartae]|uniref:Beta sliding clamp n=1 Tax=Deinobacterium chartae TaxID=521158 RepID=A0A841I3M4_9DEIO|nr:DNA polymerase-3 subunit beta [Deinobacterium chartae]
MNIQVTKKFLSDSLGILERIIPARSSNPVLTHLKIDATERGLFLSGTNLEIDLEAFVPAQVDGEASIVLPAHLFAQIVRNLGGELVELNYAGGELSVQSAGFKTKLQTGDLEAYPSLNFPSHSDLTLDARDLARSLSSVRYAAANEAFQAVFRGIKFELGGNRSRVVASDGYRLAIRDFGAGQGEAHNLILPARSADELVRVLREGEVKLTLGGNTLSVAADRVRMNLKLLDGDFPDYERVVPSDIKLSVRLPAAQLKESVSRVAVLADKNANNRVEFLVSEGKLQLAAEGDYGRAQDTLEVDQSGNDAAMSLGFNAKFVTDALGPIDGDVLIQLSGPTTPAMFKSLDDSGYLAVVVPLRV